MSKSKNPPDWWARSGALAGIILSVIGLVVAYRSYRWQQAIYQESLEERILVRAMAWRDMTVGKNNRSSFKPEGKLGVEVVNIGMRPLYVKDVTAYFAGPENDDEYEFELYDYDPLAHKPLAKLDPGEAGNYSTDVNFYEHHIMEHSAEFLVGVTTTKKTFKVKSRIDQVTVNGSILGTPKFDFVK
jgi:hypothetical protein